MSGRKLTGRPRNSINVCYLIDVAPEKFRGGGQAHLENLIRKMRFQISGFRFQIFSGLSSSIFLRLLWMGYVIPQVIFFHFFRIRFDLIHAHSVPAIAAGKVLSVILKVPIVVTIHGSTLNISNKDTPSGTGRSILYGFLEEWIFTGIKYGAQITVSRNFLGVPNVNKNIFYIPNGVDLDKFRKLPAVSLRNFTVLLVGRKNDPVKGFKVLEEAMELVRREIPDVKLLVADGLIPRDQVIKMYGMANLFVLPSLSEGFPLTLLEAWAARLPVVATAVGEVPYLFGLRSFANFSSEVCETARGYMVKPGNSKSLAQGIIMALKNPGLAKLGENGYNLAREYTWERVARETLAVYQKIC